MNSIDEMKPSYLSRFKMGLRSQYSVEVIFKKGYRLYVIVY